VQIENIDEKISVPPDEKSCYIY